MKQIRSVISYLLLLLLGATGMATAQTQTRAVGDEGSPDDPTLLCNVEVAIIGTGGTVSPNGKTLAIGDVQPFVIKANRGWVISNVELDGGTLVSADFSSGTYTYNLKAAKNQHKLTVTFSQTIFRVNVTANLPEGGTITPLSGGVKNGEDFTFTVRPAEGYTVESVNAGSGSTITDAGNGVYRLDNVTKDENITVKFKAAEYTVTVTSGSGGSLTSPTAGKYPYGKLLTVTPNPATGYMVDQITVNGVLLSGNTVKVTGDMAIKATFKPQVHTVTILSPEGGTLTAKSGSTVYRNGSYSVPYNTVLTLEAKAATGHEFKEYTLNPNGTVSNNSLTVTSDITIGATFNKTKYTVTVTAPNGQDGKLLIDGKEASNGETDYPYGTVLTLGNTPSTDKTFDAYRVEPQSALNGNRVTIESNVTISMTFKDADAGTSDPSEPGNPSKTTYPVNFPSGVIVQTADGPITSGTYVKKDTELTIIVPNSSGQVLASLAVNGTDAGYAVSGGVNIGYHKVTGTTNIVPVFKERKYKVTIGTPTGGRLDVTAGGRQVLNGEEVAYGTQLAVTATPAEGYQLEYILANALDITLSGRVTVTEDVALNVFFRPQSGFNPNPTPDPSQPDAGKPVTVDQTPQQVVYNREVQAFRLVTLPAGVLSGVTISYYQKGTSVTPKNAGRYDVVLKRPADATMSELNLSIPGGLEILKAPVSIQSLDITENPVIGQTSVTEATINGGVASYLNKRVEGAFTWADGKKQLSATASAYHTVRFVPTDQANFLETSTQHLVQVGATPPQSYRITWNVEGMGQVKVYNGSMEVSPDATFFAGTVLTLQAMGGDGYTFVRHETDFGTYTDNPMTLVVNSDMTVKSLFEQKSVPAVTISNPANLVYNGQAKLISLTSTSVQDGWQIEYKDAGGKTVVPRNAGQYTVYVTRAEDNNWQAVSQQHSFTVSRATPVIAPLPIASSVQKGAVLSDSQLTGGVATVDGLGVVPGLFSWKDGTEQMTTAGKQNKDVRFTPSDADNIFSVFQSVEIEVVEKSGGGDLPVIITYDIPSNGTLLVTDEVSKTIKSGDAVTLGSRLIVKATPSGGYRLSSLTIGGIDYTAQAVAGSGTVSFLATASKHLHVEFVKIPDPGPDPDPGPNPDPDPDPDPDPSPDPSPDPDPTPDYYTVWVMSSGRGSVQPGTTVVSPGSNKTFAITPDEGFNIIDVRVNGRSVGVVSSYTFSDIRSDQTLEAVFSSVPGPIGKSYTLTARVADEGGIVSPSLARVAAGGKQTFLIVPNEGNRVQRVLVGRSEQDLKDIGAPSVYTFANVHSDSVLVVYFSTTTATEQIELSDLRVYTENGVLHIEAEQPQDVMVVDMTGVIRFIRRISGREVVYGLTPGIYIVSSEKDGRRKSIKVRIK